MRTTLLSTFALIVNVAIMIAQTPAWVKTFGGTGGESGAAIIQTSDGGYLVAGYTSSYPTTAVALYLVKTDSDGETQWEKVIPVGTYAGNHSMALAMFESTSTYRIISRAADSTSNFRILQTVVDRAGNLVSKSLHGDPGTYATFAALTFRMSRSGSYSRYSCLGNAKVSMLR